MQVTLLKSKIHRATITESNLHYEGSITLPPSLVKQADMRLYEKVLVADVDNGNRFETYIILGKDDEQNGGKGRNEICLNGAAAHLGKPGDKIIIMTWGTMDESEAEGFTPTVVLVDENNRPKNSH